MMVRRNAPAQQSPEQGTSSADVSLPSRRDVAGPNQRPNPRLVNLSRSKFEIIPRSQWSDSLLREAGEFLDSQNSSHPFQWPQWPGEGAHLALLRRNGKIQWLAHSGIIYPSSRLLRPIRTWIVNHGPVCDDLDLLETGLHELVERAGRLGIAYIDIAPEWTGNRAESVAAMLARNGWRAISEASSSLRLLLDPPLDDLLAAFRKTTRYEIRRSLGLGIEVTVASNEAEYPEYMQMYAALAGQRGFSAERPNYLLDILRWLSSDKTRGGLFLARENGKLRGGAVIARSGARCWYVQAATSKEGKLGVGHLIQWRAIQWAKENGCREYDFCGFREDATSGPALFKKGFCDRVVRFVPVHRYIVSPGRYRASEIIARLRRRLQSAT